MRFQKFEEAFGVSVAVWLAMSKALSHYNSINVFDAHCNAPRHESNHIV